MAEWISFEALIGKKPLRGEKKQVGAAPEKKVEKSFKDSGIYELKINYIPKGMWYKEIAAKIGKKDTNVIKLEMPDSGVILEPGVPMLPIEGLYVALPAGSELVDIKVTNSDSIDYPGEIEIIPAPEPTKDGGKKYDWKEPTFKQKKDIYDSDVEYPKELFKLLSINFISGVKVAHLMIYPLHYKPKSKALVIYNNIELKVEYTPGSTISKSRGILPEAGKEEIAFAPQIQAEFKSQILNMEGLDDINSELDGGTRRIARPFSQGKLCEISNKGRYVIITTENLVDALKPLAKIKEDKGLSTKIVSDKAIYKEFQDSPEPQFKAIRDFILYAYDNWEEPPEYILLVGEIQTIPTNINTEYG
jgi:hypothetical protein